MARSNSKYFASVISKLIAAKRKENIVIDDKLKSALRMEVLARARGTVQIEKVGFAESVREFVGRWRYAFALVPSALLVVVVAAQVLKTPVTMKSDVVVPTAGQTENVSTTPTSDDAVSPTATENLQTNVLAPSDTKRTSKIKTFPGALVMPANIKKIQPEEPEVNIENQTSLPTEPLTNMPAIVVEPVAPPITTTVVPDRTGELPEDTVTSYEEIHITEENPSATDIPEDESSSPEESRDEIDTPASETPSADYAGDNLYDENPQPAMDYTEPQSDDVPDQTYEQTPPTTSDIYDNKIPTFNAQALQVKLLSYPVYYELEFSTAQKESFGTSVLGHIADSQYVSHIVVDDGEDGVVAATIYYNDGTSSTSYYQQNLQTGAWDNVQFVTRSYYDDSLQYVTNFQYNGGLQYQ